MLVYLIKAPVLCHYLAFFTNVNRSFSLLSFGFLHPINKSSFLCYLLVIFIHWIKVTFLNSHLAFYTHIKSFFSFAFFDILQSFEKITCSLSTIGLLHPSGKTALSLSTCFLSHLKRKLLFLCPFFGILHPHDKSSLFGFLHTCGKRYFSFPLFAFLHPLKDALILWHLWLLPPS
ncbi:unnamed protein product [Acanthosepion pharaonis]|uniref:Uncharacterized protein n=1 Tax=Acanthosepion pharaonis TaxID=158019 RepID=A0A812AUK5_ACAPH|nr:unnamed protein product [Sepia pharaonis]